MSRKFSIITTAVFAVCLFFAFAGGASAATKAIVSTLAHKEAGLKCIDCHETDKPTKMPHHSACIKCHDSGSGYYTGEMRTYINSGKERKFNMHDSHQGPVRCTVCHTVHKAPNEKMHCNWCHQIEVKVK
ncbi:cytochrome c3 family protein [Seleniivibrio woodruffii]|uniref:Cytochrome c3-like protein n=1 Tax=Seleniivibrio woodruffii TaxID=1078050 RepID=A0A4R1K7B4_9BACT|nr:cytochrome c3 family protein [Seleniivibrio woodruffii]TCK59920.1 cytochrome c3-like protein [Seleniivibrio woodruffii]TVZ35859.1 cytochrome c3-like protein [Seleniivibrio woodruffii]